MCDCEACRKLPPHPTIAGKHVRPDGVFPIHEWGNECMRGWVSDARFGSGPVLKRTSRQTTRKVYRARGE